MFSMLAVAQEPTKTATIKITSFFIATILP
jgi:hypothetical protein